MAALRVTRLDQVKALAHPIRWRILERLASEPATARQLADVLRTKPTALYHHFRVLQRAGLIRLTETRPKRGTIERYYEAVSAEITVDRKLSGGRLAPTTPMIAGIFESTLADLQAGDRSGGQAIVQRLMIRTSPARAAALRRRLEAWLEACRSSNREDGEAEFALTVAHYPTGGTS